MGFLSCLVVVSTWAEDLKVDFCYSMPEWQTMISIADADDKMLVNSGGELLLDYRSHKKWMNPNPKPLEKKLMKRYGKHAAFGLRITPDLPEALALKEQNILSPRTPVLATVWKSDFIRLEEEAFCAVDGAKQQGAVLSFRIANTSGKTVLIKPKFQLAADQSVSFDKKKGVIKVGSDTVITASSGIELLQKVGEDDLDYYFELQQTEVSAGNAFSFALMIGRCGKPLSPEKDYRQGCLRYWSGIDLPCGRIRVPDTGIQSLIDSSIRNLHQAREYRNGKLSYSVGPTVYRGLWIVDGAFMLECATMLGEVEDARNGLEFMWTYQKEDGRFEKIPKYWKENGIVVWAVMRHAFLTQDKKWLESQWPGIKRVMGAIERLRAESLQEKDSPDYGLFPGGFIDGGIGYRKPPEFSNIYWLMTGIKAYIDGARWLGKNEEACEWQKTYDQLQERLAVVLKRETLKDEHGNRYVPTMMGNKQNYSPQRGQWAFCHSVYPGQIYEEGSGFVAGQLSMLEATKREGMVYGTGWDAEGIWNYFASFYGHAQLWQGNGREAVEALYAFANHASPTLCWREEQALRDEKFNIVGDMPHNWASAEFIRLAVHLIAVDRGDELHLLQGVPREWAGPGMVTRLKEINTPFGPLTLELRVDDSGNTYRLKASTAGLQGCSRIIVHREFIDSDKEALAFEPGQDVEVEMN